MSGPDRTRAGVGMLVAGRLRHDPHLVVLREVRDDDVEHEAIELRFGQRVSALELDRVLRREHEERLLEWIGPAGRGDVILLHRFEQRGLRLRRRAVDLVGQDDLREDRPLDEAQAPAALALVEDLGAGDVRRHQVGRELDALEVEIEDVGERLDQERLGEAGDAGDQAMAAGEQREQDLLDDLVLSDDHLPQFAEDPLATLGHPFRARADRVHRSPSADLKVRTTSRQLYVPAFRPAVTRLNVSARRRSR